MANFIEASMRNNDGTDLPEAAKVLESAYLKKMIRQISKADRIVRKESAKAIEKEMRGNSSKALIKGCRRGMAVAEAKKIAYERLAEREQNKIEYFKSCLSLAEK